MKSFVLGSVALVVGLAAAATPESLGVSSRGVSAWIDACERELDALHGFVLLRHGETVAEGSWAPYDTLNQPHMLFSHSKSFTSTAIGFLVDDGKIDLDERIVDLFPDKVPVSPSQNLRQLRVRDLLTMNVGAKRTDAERDDNDGDWERAFLANRIDLPPGTQFRYDSGATYLLSALVERKSGRNLMEFLDERLFSRIGIDDAWSTMSPSGTACGGWGMNMTTRDLAKFGQFYLNGGKWKDRQLLSSDWITLATSRQTWSGAIAVTGEDGSDWHQGYGFQFWRCRHGFYRADGANGQLTVVMPKLDAVLSVHAGLDDMQKELNLVWEHLVPAIKDKSLKADEEGAAALSAKCAALAIRPPAVGNRTAIGRFAGQKFSFAPNAHGVKSVELVRGLGDWECRLATAAADNRIPIGSSMWQKGTIVIDKGPHDPLGSIVGRGPLPVASVWWTDEQGGVRVRIVLTTGPQRIDLAFSDANGTKSVAGEIRGIGGCKLEQAVAAGTL